jgi:hypothetical protein
MATDIYKEDSYINNTFIHRVTIKQIKGVMNSWPPR